jgi:GT2 family glycosyltransferase
MMTIDRHPLPSSSLLICTRNRPVLLRDTIASVMKGSACPAEIVIVDQSDVCDGEIAAMSRPDCEVRYHHINKVGVSHARNTALSLARQDLLAFLDDDMLVREDWHEALISALVKFGMQTIVTGRIMPYAEGPDGFAPSTKTSLEPEHYAGRITIDPLAAGHMALYRSAFDRIGRFDERLGPGTPFPAAEDNDFGYRALQSGCVIRYVPEAVSYHRAWRRNRDYWTLRWHYGRGQGSFYAKHFSLKDRFMLRRMGREVARRLARMPAQLFSRPWWAASDLVYTCALLSGAGEWLVRHPRK